MNSLKFAADLRAKKQLKDSKMKNSLLTSSFAIIR